MNTQTLEHALLVALALPEERDLALLRPFCTSGPDRAPESAPALRLELARQLATLRATGAAVQELRHARELGLELAPWGDPRYPASLLELAGPPPLLYLRGCGPWPPVAPITIVGARASTARGRAFAHDLGAAIAERAGTVVSGLAIGIDQAAHEGALTADGSCCAVLACGLDRIYPPGAAPLARRIEARGRIVSEMPIGTPPYKSHFPRRNRILAALSRATLVIEADLQSGSLITAHRALELGRNVHAVPGTIDAPTSRGTNRLIRDGAHPLLEISDLDLILPRSSGANRRRASGEDGVAGGGAGADELLAALAAPLAAEELARRVGAALDRVLIRLVELEADGRVIRLGGGLYQRAD